MSRDIELKEVKAQLRPPFLHYQNFEIRVDLQSNSNSHINITWLCEGWLSEELGPAEHTVNHPPSSLIPHIIASDGFLFHPLRTLEACNSRGLLYPSRKALTSIRRGGVLCFQLWNPSTQHMCYKWAPSLPIMKGPHLNPSRWCVVVPIRNPWTHRMCYTHSPPKKKRKKKKACHHVNLRSFIWLENIMRSLHGNKKTCIGLN